MRSNYSTSHQESLYKSFSVVSEEMCFYQEQSQAQRELWMMEDIMAGLKINRDHFRFLLGLQRHHSKHQLCLTVTLVAWIEVYTVEQKKNHIYR